MASWQDEYHRLQVLEPGTRVAIGTSKDEEIVGTIISVEINENLHVRYQVVWWDMRQRQECHMEEYELRPLKDESERLKIGFVECLL